MTFPKNILIVRTDRIGDVVLSLPLAAIIKKHSPQTKISFLLRGYTRPLAEGNPFIDEVIALYEKGGKPAIRENLIQLKDEFDACVVAFPTYPIALLLYLSNIPIRIGSGYRWYSFLFNKKIYEHRKHGERHELEYNVSLLQQLEINYNANETNVSFGINPSDNNKEKIEADFRAIQIDQSRKLIIVHPGSGGSSINLPTAKMKALVESLSKMDCNILLTGSKNEKELCDSMVVNNNVTSVAGKYVLSELIALLDRCDLMIANSTGPIHIAAALGKYVIGFYPKIASCAAKRWGPYTNKKVIFSPTIECGNCTREQCEKLNCMESINISEVVEKAKQILE
jgi:ADP-heptose:LPS heptosyltransferase